MFFGGLTVKNKQKLQNFNIYHHQCHWAMQRMNSEWEKHQVSPSKALGFHKYYTEDRQTDDPFMTQLKRAMRTGWKQQIHKNEYVGKEANTMNMKSEESICLL